MSASKARVGIVTGEGHVRPPGEYFPIVNPATGQVWAEALECDERQVDHVVTSAQKAYQAIWRRTSAEERGAYVGRWAELISTHREELAQLETTDAGHLLSESSADVDRAVAWLRYYAGMADKIEGRTLQQDPTRLAYQMREPYGVVVGINPFNANFTLFAWKAGPALVAGNCFILKAAELAPMSSYRVAELALEAGIPAGIVSVVTGRGDSVGPRLGEHPGVGALMFTGGPDAGRAVIRQSAAHIMPIGLELGGKSAVVVLEDADLETLVPSILHSNFVKCGQSCMVGSRIYLPLSLYETVCEKLARVATGIRVGMPTEPLSQMGTMIGQPQRDRVDLLVQNASKHGARVIAGGAPVTSGDLANGAFYQPTVVADVVDDNVVARTETFGPVASVMVPYRDIDEVLARANSLPMGLTAQVWGNDSRILHYLARNLEAGTVWINSYRLLHPTLPYGGVKESGYGRENGFDALSLYTRSKTVVWNLAESTPLPYS